MLRRMEVLRGVVVWRVVAAADVPAFQAFAQMHPPRSDLEAIFAAGGAWFDVLDVIEMGADRHRP